MSSNKTAKDVRDRPTTHSTVEDGRPTPELAQGFVLLDNSTHLDAVSLLYEHPADIIRADAPSEVAAALEALTAGLAKGMHAAGFFLMSLAIVLSRNSRR